MVFCIKKTATAALAAFTALLFAAGAFAAGIQLQLSPFEENVISGRSISTSNSHGAVICGHPLGDIYKAEYIAGDTYDRYFRYDLRFLPAGLSGGTVRTSGMQHCGIYQIDGFPCAFDCVIDENSGAEITAAPSRCVRLTDADIKTTGTDSHGIRTDCFEALNTTVRTTGANSAAVYGSAFRIEGGSYISDQYSAVNYRRSVSDKETLRIFDHGIYDVNDEFEAYDTRDLEAFWDYGVLNKAKIINSSLKAGSSAIEMYGGSIEVAGTNIVGGSHGVYIGANKSDISISGGTLECKGKETVYCYGSFCNITLENVVVKNSATDVLAYFNNCMGSSLNLVNQSAKGEICFKTNYPNNFVSLYEGSAFVGKITGSDTAKVLIDSNSSWTLTGDSYINSLERYGTVNLNGHVLYINGEAYTDLAPYAVTGISLNKTSLSLETGKSEKLTATVAPENALNKKIVWTSYDDNVATVDTDGVVKAVAPGSTTIRAKTRDGGFIAKCKVKVTEPTVAVTGVTLSKTSVTIDKGKTVTLKATVAPAGATNKKVTWTSYDTSIATVTADGVVKGVKPGSTTIRVKTKDGGSAAPV